MGCAHSQDLENPTVAVYFNNVMVRNADGFEDRRFVFQVISPSVYVRNPSAGCPGRRVRPLPPPPAPSPNCPDRPVRRTHTGSLGWCRPCADNTTCRQSRSASTRSGWRRSPRSATCATPARPSGWAPSPRWRRLAAWRASGLVHRTRQRRHWAAAPSCPWGYASWAHSFRTYWHANPMPRVSRAHTHRNGPSRLRQAVWATIRSLPAAAASTAATCLPRRWRRRGCPWRRCRVYVFPSGKRTRVVTSNRPDQAGFASAAGSVQRSMSSLRLNVLPYDEALVLKESELLFRRGTLIS